MPDRRVLDLPGAGRNRSDDDFTSVHAHAHRDRRLALRAQLAGILAQLVLHPQGRIQSTLRMVLMRDRRSEQREDAITRGLHDVAVVAMRRFDHQLQRGIDDCARLFGIEVLLKLGRALDVGEERGDGFALAFDIFGINSLTYADTGSVGLICYRSRPF